MLAGEGEPAAASRVPRVSQERLHRVPSASFRDAAISICEYLHHLRIEDFDCGFAALCESAVSITSTIDEHEHDSKKGDCCDFSPEEPYTLMER